MQTKQILIVIAAFFLGGILGFLVNGQICAQQMHRDFVHCKMMERGNCRYNGPADRECFRERGNERGFRGRGALMIEEISEQLNLSDTQNTAISALIKEHREKNREEKGNSKERRERIKTLVENVKKQLTTEQQTKFDELLDQYAPPFMDK